MKEIRCPKCQSVFTVDQATYAEIVTQVRNTEFEKSLQDKFESMNNKHQLELEKSLSTARDELNRKVAEKDTEITRLKGITENAKTASELAVKNALGDAEKLIVELQSKVEIEIANNKFNKTKTEADHNNEVQALRHKLDTTLSEAQINESNLKERHRQQLEDRDQEIERYKDLKAKLSTKMLGETLEQHCEIEFEKIRHTAFPNAYFEKDNAAIDSTKGDYIFRQMTAENTEIISIMFEMKNESDGGEGSKQKNERFLQKLDKDRRDKGCEYAILVSLLERDSELYNGGIVDVSHKYPKMFVIRPQFFIPMISILHNSAMRSVEYKNELAIIKAQHTDITNFEESLETFKAGFARNFELAGRQFSEAIKQIDKSIDALQKTKENLQKSENNLRLANNKAQDVSIQRLTSSSPIMRERFAALPHASIAAIDQAS